MTKKAKAKKSKAKRHGKFRLHDVELPARAAETKATTRKALTKVARVQALCERAEGATLEQIVDELQVSKQAASSLIGDLRRKKIAVVFKDGVYKL
jgi:hypothetical protein